MLLRSEKKSVNWMVDLMYKHCNARKLGMEKSVGTLAAPKAYLQLTKHRCLDGHEKDFVCPRDTLPSPLEMDENRFLSPDSNIDCSEESFEAKKVVMKEMIALGIKNDDS